MQAIAAIILIGLAALFGFTLFVVESWMPPFRPVLLGMLGLCPALVAIAFAVSPKLRGEERSMGALVGVVVVSVLFGAAPLAWSVPQVRATLADVVAQGPTLRKAYGDEDRGVRMKVCEKSLRVNEPVQDVFMMINSSPEFATECLALVPEYEGQGEIARRLVDQWYEVAILEEEDGCEQTREMAALAKDASTKGSRLLALGLGAASEKTRACAVEVLGAEVGKGSTMWTRVESQIGVLSESALEGELLAASFGVRTQMTQEQASSLDLTNDAVQRGALERVCERVVARDTTPRMQKLFEYVLESERTCMSEIERQQYAEEVRVCELLLEKMGSSPNLTDLMCEAQRETIRVELAAKQERLIKGSKVADASTVDQIRYGTTGLVLEAQDLEKYDSRSFTDPKQLGLMSKNMNHIQNEVGARMRSAVDLKKIKKNPKRALDSKIFGVGEEMGEKFRNNPELMKRLYDEVGEDQAKEAFEAMGQTFDEENGTK